MKPKFACMPETAAMAAWHSGAKNSFPEAGLPEEMGATAAMY